MCYSMNCRFKRADFLTEKGSAIISLGQNYCYMGSTQKPSRDTVPLKWFNKTNVLSLNQYEGTQ
jgi:hypothetical protein